MRSLGYEGYEENKNEYRLVRTLRTLFVPLKVSGYEDFFIGDFTLFVPFVPYLLVILLYV